MHEFKLDEISAVDAPAQAGARATIMKHDGVVENERTREEQLEDLRTNPTAHGAAMLKIRCERDYGRLMQKSGDWLTSEEFAKIDAVQREADALACAAR
ncbi:MAG: hypothetical protein GXP06_13895 [Alphaproteobacteria bacterium]|nr:hypothetical protein [Alphaproteobacteria bacterium]